MTDPKAKLILNIGRLMASKLTPPLSENAKLIQEIEQRVARACSSFVGLQVNDRTIAQLNASISETVDAHWYSKRKTLSAPPLPHVFQCQQSPGTLHALVIPHDYSGTKTYPCGCLAIFDNGRMIRRPTPPSVRYIR
jgi:hypothetical protein